MTDHAVRNVLIVGGGTAGWMTAAALSRTLGTSVSITLVESDAIGTVGVGEATIPHISTFNRLLGIDEDDFLRQTQGTFKLGIEFAGWGQPEDSYIHPFGVYGVPMDAVAFHHYWYRLERSGGAPLSDYSLACVAARDGKFTRPVDIPKSPLAQIVYAFHIDASLYAKYLRSYAEARGVKRVEGRINDVRQNTETGFVESVTTEDGRVLSADLFVDCSGFRGLLIEKTLGAGYVDWSHYLPCDRAVAAPSENVGPPPPYTRSTARRAGWQWRIPLQHRVGNGYVYSSKIISDDEAASCLAANVNGRLLAEPRHLRFVPGRRRKVWDKNVVAIGLSSGFIEPLESTSIHLIQSGVARLIALFPDRRFLPAVAAEYNRQSVGEIESILDFIVLHYHANQRVGSSELWDYCREMAIPDSLAQRLDLFRSGAQLFREGDELFSETSWLAVLHGQGVQPSSYHKIADTADPGELKKYLDGVRDVIRRSAEAMPTHAEFIRRHCAAQGALPELERTISSE